MHRIFQTQNLKGLNNIVDICTHAVLPRYDVSFFVKNPLAREGFPLLNIVFSLKKRRETSSKA